MNDNFEIWFGIIVIILILFAIIFAIGFNINWYNSQEIVTITVENKDIKAGNKSSKYLIWTKENEVFENVDSFLFGKFNSSDLYGQIEVGKTYKVLVAGFRIPFWSMYRNIIRFEN